MDGVKEPRPSIYMDYAATSPMPQEVWEAMQPYWEECFANPASVHPMGSTVNWEVMQARESLAFLLNCQPRELIITSGASEADNQAVWTGWHYGYARKETNGMPHIIATEMEHEAVREPLLFLQRKHLAEVTFLHPGPSGLIQPNALREAIRPQTCFVSIMAVNNEVGTIQPIAELVECVRSCEGKDRILFHTDAVQAAPHLPIDCQEWGVDILSLSAHKFGGPKGIGLLFAKQGVPVEPLIRGGAQERGLRAGTTPVPGIIGMTKALEWTRIHLKEEERALHALGHALMEGLRRIKGVHLTVEEADRLPGIVHITVEGQSHEVLLAQLGRRGLSLSAGSACQAGAVTDSYVLAALDVPEARRRGALRFSLGWKNTKEDIVFALQALQDVIEKG